CTREEGWPAVGPDLVAGDEGGVLPPRGQLALAPDPLPRPLGRDPAGQDHLQGHQPAQVAMPRLVDDPHPAAPDLAEDDVLPDLAGGRRTLTGGVRRGRAPAPGLPTPGAGRPPPRGPAPPARGPAPPGRPHA